MQLTADKEARFWAKVERQGDETACWNWLGASNPSGYGRFAAVGRKLYGAHRVAYYLAGHSIPDGMVVDHTCRNRACVNPAHLRAVDRATNVHENSEARAHLNSLKTHCYNGHELSGGNLIMDRGQRRCRACKNERQKARRVRAGSGPDYVRVP